MQFFITLLFLYIPSFPLIAQSPGYKISINVDGNCKMCKKNIEKACKVEGVQHAVWDVKSHQLNLEFDSNKITLDQIQLRIAAAGYDTPAYKANLEKYNQLHSCCQYRK